MIAFWMENRSLIWMQAVKESFVCTKCWKVFENCLSLLDPSFYCVKKDGKSDVVVVPPSVHFSSTTPNSIPGSVVQNADIKRSSSPQTMDAASEYLKHSRSSSSPVRVGNNHHHNSATTPEHYTANLHKPIIKLAKSQSLWDDSSAPSRFVGSLVSSVAHGLTGSGSSRRRKRWEIPGYVFVVIKGYEPAFKDELSISIGNIIRIKKIFDDVNQSTEIQGILPMAFLTCINPTSPSAPPIDPQQFIPRSSGSVTPTTTTTTTTAATPTATIMTEEVEEAILPYTDLPPQHLRKRGRSVSKAVTPTMSYAELQPSATTHYTPQQQQQEQTPITTNTTISVTERPRGRSSSLHRNAREGGGGGRGRGRSTSKGGMLKSSSTMSLKSASTSAQSAAAAVTVQTTLIVDASGAVVATVPLAPISRGRMNSVASATSSMRRGRRGKSGESVYHELPDVGEVSIGGGGGEGEGEEEGADQFEDSLMDLTGDDVTLLQNRDQVGAGNGGGGGDDDDEIEEVVVFEEDDEFDDVARDETSASLSDEDRDVWPPVRPSMDRKSRVSLGGYSMA
ncbi:hypothetical protein BDR26DRAFT_860204 [Obelidium mucronatum]|nr:hypothetical protein BDR26DRAFT_860204 [Obelidium mucronatum]